MFGSEEGGGRHFGERQRKSGREERSWEKEERNKQRQDISAWCYFWGWGGGNLAQNVPFDTECVHQTSWNFNTGIFECLITQQWWNILSMNSDCLTLAHDRQDNFAGCNTLLYHYAYVFMRVTSLKTRYFCLVITPTISAAVYFIQ